MLGATSPISMEVGPDGCVYIAEFAGFWKAAAGANVSRYCWVHGDSPTASTNRAAPATGGSSLSEARQGKLRTERGRLSPSLGRSTPPSSTNRSPNVVR